MDIRLTNLICEGAMFGGTPDSITMVLRSGSEELAIPLTQQQYIVLTNWKRWLRKGSPKPDLHATPTEQLEKEKPKQIPNDVQDADFEVK